MANRSFVDSNFTLVKRQVTLYAAVSVGAAGAVTLQKWGYPTLGAGGQSYATAPTGAVPVGAAYPNQYQVGAEGVLSVTRTAAGLWTVKLQDNYQRCLGVTAQGQLAGGLSAIVNVGLNSTITSMTAANGSVIGLALLSATATAADPASGETILLTIQLADATEP